MTRVSRVARPGGAAIAALALLAACSTESSDAVQTRTIKIGAIVPLEGPQAGLGDSFAKAVQVSVDNLGDTDNRYELVIEDGGTTPQASEAAARKLVDIEGVDAIVGGISATGKLVKPIAAAAGVPQICVCSVETIGDGDYNFTNIPLAQDEAEVWVAEARRRGVDRIAIFAQDYPSINGHVKALKEEAAAAGMTIVYDTSFDANTTEFQPRIVEAVDSNPDLYFVSGFEPSLTALGTQLKAVEQIHPGTEIKIASIVALSLSNDMSVFEGDWYTDSRLANDDVQAQFEEAYPSTEFVTHMMPYAYDSVRMLVDAFESGQEPIDYLRGLVSYDGSNGPITRDPETGNFRSKPSVWVVRNGRPAVAGTSDSPGADAPASGGPGPEDQPSTDMPGPHDPPATAQP